MSPRAPPKGQSSPLGTFSVAMSSATVRLGGHGRRCGADGTQASSLSIPTLRPEKLQEEWPADGLRPPNPIKYAMGEGAEYYSAEDARIDRESTSPSRAEVAWPICGRATAWVGSAGALCVARRWLGCPQLRESSDAYA